MIGSRPGRYWIICWRYVSPFLIVVSIIAEFYTKSLIDYIIWIVPLSLRNIHDTGDDNTVVTKLILVLVTNIGFSMIYHRVIVVHGNCQQTSSYIMTTSFTENWDNKWKHPAIGRCIETFWVSGWEPTSAVKGLCSTTSSLQQCPK